MQLTVNDTPQTVAVNAVATLKEVLEKVPMPGNMLVTGVPLNGRQLETDWTTRADAIYVMEEDKLALTVQPAAMVGRAALLGTQPQFAALCEDFGRIADSFRMDDEVKANNHFALAVDNLQTFFRIVQEALLLIGRNFNDLRIDGMPMTAYMEQFGAKLGELIDVQKNHDWVLLADLIEYELAPLLKKLDAVYTQV